MFVPRTKKLANAAVGRTATMRWPSIQTSSKSVKSYTDLGELQADEIMRRLDAQDVPLHPGDKALAVIVLAALADLRRATDRLDRTSTRLDRWGFFLAVVATAATVGQLVAVLA